MCIWKATFDVACAVPNLYLQVQYLTLCVNSYTPRASDKLVSDAAVPSTQYSTRTRVISGFRPLTFFTFYRNRDRNRDRNLIENSSPCVSELKN